MRTRTISEFFVDLIGSQNDIDLKLALIEMCKKFGWTNATFFGLNLPGTNFGDNVLITTYHKDWVERYQEQNYKYIDPIVTAGIRSLLPMDWAAVPADTNELRAFFGEARELGVGSSGLSISVRGQFGDCSLFSVNSSEIGRNWQLQRNEIISDLTYFAHLFHSIVSERLNLNEQFDMPKLAPREQDVLRWAARGKTAWETGRILNISEKTVAFYLSNATTKLGVASKTEAVATAISRRLLIM
jgi:DNA-binding CsgD family transcriptional regulator